MTYNANLSRNKFVHIGKSYQKKYEAAICEIAKLKEALTTLRHKTDFKTIEEVNIFIDKALGENNDS